MKEKEVLKKVLKMLESYKYSGRVLWYARMQAGCLGNVTLGKAGQPDIMAVINQDNGNISVLFLEVKATGIDGLRYEQQAFFDSMAGKPKILCEVISNPKDLIIIIRKCVNL